MRPALTLDLLAAPVEVSGVRRALGAYGADVQLCASELVTNVIRHVGEGVPVTVRVSCEDDGRTRLEVTDPDPRALPVLRAAVGADEESGRGLALLDALAVKWGVTHGPPGTGKTVWCELGPGTAERPGRRGSPSGALAHPSARS
ncbi:ATP-binding protein [Streptomyces sp. DH24]|uniref:ATP-binding protein n=1 Tax=Streptomyces sp. DH24 TaxID=3040123 RepID=UPI002442D628|nr:ATP-binding protein [Streptomyces sp. DH24]MDG9716324.1 ATP-binding protein [Streptomyces sp. DH24]